MRATERDLGAVPRRPLVVADPADPIGLVVERMARAERGVAVVTDGTGRIVGLFGEVDLLARVEHGDPDWRRARVDTVMTRDPATGSPGDSVAEALTRMRTRVQRHLPVIDRDGKLLAVLSARDLLEDRRDER